jgi:multidrug transporter EmrE-like cation transporter
MRMRFPLRVLVLSVLVVITNVAGNYFLSIGVKAARHGPGFHWLWCFREPALYLGVTLLIFWLLLRLALLSATDMSIVLPVTAGFAYVLTSMAGQFWLKESVHWMHNAGLSMIAVGVVLVGISARTANPRGT